MAFALAAVLCGLVPRPPPSRTHLVSMAVAEAASEHAALSTVLERRIGCSPTEVRRVAQRLGAARARSIDIDAATRRCDALEARLALSEEQLRKVVVRRPSLLGLSFDANVAPTLAKLQARLGLSEAQLQRLVVANPMLIGCSFHANVEPSLAKLQNRLQLSEEQLRKVVVAHPPVLGYSHEANLAPKLDFLQTELGLSAADLRDSIVAFPANLGYSLDKRYRPRLRATRLVGADASAVLRYAAWPNARFCAAIGADEQCCV